MASVVPLAVTARRRAWWPVVLLPALMAIVGASVDPRAFYAPDLVLVDLGLPGLNGYEVARRIRAELDPAIRLVALTGYSREADVKAAEDAGFDKYLIKSVDPQDLIAGLEAFLA